MSQPQCGQAAQCIDKRHVLKCSRMGDVVQAAMHGLRGSTLILMQ